MQGKPLQVSQTVSSHVRLDLFFERLMDNLPGAAYICDTEGLITYFNDRAVELWGRTPKLNDPEDRFCGSYKIFDVQGIPLQHSDCLMALCLKHGTVYNGEEVVVERPDGERKTVLAHVNPLHDEAGHLIGAINLLIDMGDRHVQAEAAARLVAIVESSDDAIISKDLNGTIKSWNRAAERLFGYSPEEAVGQSVTLIIPPDRLDEEADILARLRDGQRIEHYETIRRRKDGTLFDISLTISPVIDERGRIVGASKIGRDISEKKQAERALREQAQTLAAINRVAGTLSAELDLERLVQAVTDAGTEVARAEFGAFFYNVVGEGEDSYTLFALSGASNEDFADFPMPRKTKVFSPTFDGEAVVRSDDITNDERFGKNPPYSGMPEGHLPVRSYLAVPVVSRTGEVLGGLFFGHREVGVFGLQAEEIISALASHAATAIDNANLYEEARRLNETLEEKVEQRTADLQELNAELETFNYSVAHDLRGSLRGIDGYSQIILQECGSELSESARHGLQRINNATLHMGAVIDNLLELSKLIQIPIVRRKVDLGDLARSAVARIATIDADRRISLEISEDLVALGDEGLLQMVMDNLISNAWKFTRDRTLTRIEIGHDRREDVQAYYVKDNGEGFDMAYSDKLYKPFQRLHSPGQFEGTGIGLATVQRIIHKHGGRIWAESAPGKGATFWFTLDS